MSEQQNAVDPKDYQSSAYELFPQPDRHNPNPWTDTKTRIHGGNGSIRIDERKEFRAVKTIQKQAGFQDVKALQRELTVLFTLSQHERSYRLGLFVEAYEWFEDEDAVHIAMEYCNGGDLRSFAHNTRQSAMKGAFIGDFVSIFTQMARGLEYMHSLSIAHCDFTPKNILLKVDPSPSAPTTYHVRIADFGLSKHIHQITGSTRAGGVNLYMSPELANYKSRYGEAQPDALACDCWAFGICIYDVLVGEALHPELSHITNDARREEDWIRGRRNLQRADSLSETTSKWTDFLFNQILNGLIEVDLGKRATAKSVYGDMREGTFQDEWFPKGSSKLRVYRSKWGM